MSSATIREHPAVQRVIMQALCLAFPGRPMPQWLSDALEKSAYFMPHGHCYLWIPWLLWLHVLSDFLIGAAYLGISLILWALVRKIRLPFSPVFIAFGLFIGLCGMTHFMEIWTAWNPDYIFEGLVKAATAAASVATAIGLFYIRPQVEEVVYTARLSEERRIKLESTHAELEATLAQVRELNELKGQFFANVSHELRTPLTLILGPAEHLLADDTLTTSQRRQLESISANGKMLLKQVNDLLDLAKLDFGNAELAYAEFDVAAWLRRLVGQFEIAAEQRELRLVVQSPDRLVVHADQDKLERIVVNLLSNALKFTPRGGAVEVGLSEQDGMIRIAVSDTGPGVPVDQREAIFERFRQAEGSATREHGGTGLGLAIVKEFVELHGGTVTVSDAAGGGSSFIAALPKAAPRALDVSPAPVGAGSRAPALEGALHELSVQASTTSGESLPSVAGRPEVLVVEDNPELRAFMAGALAERFNVITAADGVEGLTEARALRPDLVITDVMMPRMSGDQLVEALRADAQFDTVPVLLLTAKADDELRVRMLASGAQDYLTKPFQPQELLARAGNLIGAKRAGDALRTELASLSTDLVGLAETVSQRNRQLRLAVETAEVAREQAEAASRTKSAFLGVISHELRTPLSTLNMTLQVISRDTRNELPAALASRMERLMRASSQMTSLVEGLLEYTRVESGRLRLQLERIDVTELAREIMRDHVEQVPPGVQMEMQPAPEDMPALESDRRLLSVVIGNLLSNALKFTQQGAVTLRLAHTAEVAVIEVADTGIGIAPEDLERIFEPFEQLEPVRRKSVPGMGLGLALVRQLVQAIGGRIDLSSTVGEGTLFRVSLPIQQPRNES
ncbi:ATP-binding protein [Lysobacter korlensis]|uniref:histidine kinase n=1 Tax=Lysobacter korlensis TaxID=553636 RepID=A0ABV6RSQ5_9GAMM